MLHFAQYNPGQGWAHLTNVPQLGEIDTLHVAEGGGEAAGGIAKYALLFVAFSCAVPAEADPVSATAVPVGMLKLYDLVHVEGGAPRESFPLKAGLFVAHKQAIQAMDSALLPTGQFVLATGSADGTIKLWTPDAMPSPQHVPQWALAGLDAPAGHVRAITCLAFTGHGATMRLMSGSDDRTVKVWNFMYTAAPPLRTLPPPFAMPPVPGAAGVSGAGAFGTGGGKWGGKAAAAAASASDFTVTCIDEVHITGASVIIVGYSDGHVRCWNAANPDDPQLIMMQGYSLDAGPSKLTVLRAQALAAAPDDPIIIAGYEDGSLIVTDLVHPGGLTSPLFTLSAAANTGHAGAVLDLVPASGDLFLSGGADGRMLMWRLTPEGDNAAA
jgi:WD40 repeat protein